MFVPGGEICRSWTRREMIDDYRSFAGGRTSAVPACDGAGTGARIPRRRLRRRRGPGREGKGVPLGTPWEPGVWGRHGGRWDGGAAQHDDRIIGLDNGGQFRRRRCPRGMVPPSRWTGSRCPARRCLSSRLPFVATLFARVSWCSLSRPATPKMKG